MPATADRVKHGGRRGRRTAGMVRIARERIATLFALAEREAATGNSQLADRYVDLARRVGTRYNVRLLPEFRELYCRGCSAFWVEGRSVRTRLRSGRRVRTCLRCGRTRRTPTRDAPSEAAAVIEPGRHSIPRDDVVLAELPTDDDSGDSFEDETEEG